MPEQKDRRAKQACSFNFSLSIKPNIAPTASCDIFNGFEQNKAPNYNAKNKLPN